MKVHISIHKLLDYEITVENKEPHEALLHFIPSETSIIIAQGSEHDN